MKIVEGTYDQPASVRRADAVRPGLGIIVGFLAITAITVFVASNLGSLKYGALNWLFVVLAVLLLILGVATFPLLKANYRYMRPRLNRWHLIWYGIYISSLVWEVRTLADYQRSVLGAYAILRIGPEFLIGMYFLYLMGTGRVKWVSSLFRGIPGVLAAYCLFCATTSIWSVFGPWTLFKSLEYMLDVSVIAALLCVASTSEELKTFLDWTWTIFVIELVWCVMQIPIFPGQALDDGRLCGVFPLTGFNSVGSEAAVIAAFALCRLVPITEGVFERSWYFALFLFGTTITVMSQTRNTLAGLVAAIVVILMFNKRATGILLIGFSAAAILFTTLGAILTKFLHRGQSQDAFDSMSGRLVWWHYAWIWFKEHPWGGVGAYAGGKFAVLKALHAAAPSTTHSDYIELLVGTGVPGTVLFCIALIWTLVALFRYWRDETCSPKERQLSMECFAVLLVIFIHSFFNVEVTWHAPMFFLACVGWAEFVRRKKKKSAELAFRRTMSPQFQRTTDLVFSQN